MSSVMSTHKFGKVRSRQQSEKQVEDILKRRPVSALLSDAYLGVRVDQHVEHVIKDKYMKYLKFFIENQINKEVNALIKKHLLLPGSLLIQLTSETKDEYGYFILVNGRNNYTLPKSGLIKALELTQGVDPYINKRRIDLTDFCQVNVGDSLQFQDNKQNNTRFYTEILLEFKLQ